MGGYLMGHAEDVAARLQRIKRKREKTWITSELLNMKAWAERPDRWWISTPEHGMNVPPPYQPEDYMLIKDNLVFGYWVWLDWAGQDNAEATRILRVASDKYSAAEIPMEVIDEAKRAIFGVQVPLVEGNISKVNRTQDYWRFMLMMPLPQSLKAGPVVTAGGRAIAV